MEEWKMEKRVTGFTFWELLMVFAIIAVLVAILYPLFRLAREKANETEATRQRQRAERRALFLKDLKRKNAACDIRFPNRSTAWVEVQMCEQDKKDKDTFHLTIKGLHYGQDSPNW
jgi:type II secretory pathway pseudopilin PulG